MLIATVIFILMQFVVAAVSPSRFIYLSLWVQTLPYTWNWNAQTVFDTPLGPLNVVAMQMFGFCLACGLVVVSHLDRALSETKRFKWHVAFLAFCVMSLTYASSTAYGLRMIAKLLGPFLFMIVILATMQTGDELRKMRNAILGSGALLLLLALLARLLGINSDPNVSATGISGLGPPGMGPPVFSAHMLPVAMLALASYASTRRFTALVMVVVFTTAIIAALQRTSAAALYMGFSAILFFGTRGIWRVLGPICVLLCLPALLLFSESFRRHMFYGAAGPEQLLADPMKALGSVNGSGRFSLWDDMLQRFFAPHPFLGSGIGSTQDYLYGQAVTGAGVVHSEYVRLLCEVGVVGLMFFGIAALSYLARLQDHVRHSQNPANRVPALAAIGSVVAYLVFLSTDNGFDYVSQFGIYVFALIAVAEKMRQLSSIVEAGETNAGRYGAPLFSNLMK